MKLKNRISLAICSLIICIASTQAKQNRIKPYGLRRTYEHGFGDRYYTGVPAYSYQHLWPEWKREIWYTIGDWNNEDAPQWVTYYDYPYVVWPNFYRYFGSPYYTREQREKRKLTKATPKKSYTFNDDNALF
jgi:hypothetical protein